MLPVFFDIFLFSIGICIIFAIELKVYGFVLFVCVYAMVRGLFVRISPFFYSHKLNIMLNGELPVASCELTTIFVHY